MSKSPSRPPRRRRNAPTQIREICLVGDPERRYTHAAIGANFPAGSGRRDGPPGSPVVARP